jgi:hypothetical protein
MLTFEERFWTECLYLMKTCDHWFMQPYDMPPPLNCKVCGEVGRFVETPATLSVQARKPKDTGLYIKVPRAEVKT